MKLTTIHWNIGGGKGLAANNNSDLQASYTDDAMPAILGYLRDRHPDILTLNEIQESKDSRQVQYIAEQLGMPYYVYDLFSDSHITTGHNLGQAIISRYPLHDHERRTFQNHGKSVVWEDGGKVEPHDKGVTQATATINRRELIVMVTHLFPFRRFDINPYAPGSQPILADIQSNLSCAAPHALLQGDFNLDAVSLEPVLPSLFTDQWHEVKQSAPTTPSGHHYDHVLFRGLTLSDSSVDAHVSTDHYPVVSQFLF